MIFSVPVPEAVYIKTFGKFPRLNLLRSQHSGYFVVVSCLFLTTNYPLVIYANSAHVDFIFLLQNVVFSSLQCTHGSGIFELQVLEMSNPHGELLTGQCCGGGQRSPNRCLTPCQTFFRLCLKEYQSNVSSTGSCSFGNTSSSVLGRDTFTLSDPERGKLVLPFTFRWTVSFLPRFYSVLVNFPEIPEWSMRFKVSCAYLMTKSYTCLILLYVFFLGERIPNQKSINNY